MPPPDFRAPIKDLLEGVDPSDLTSLSETAGMKALLRIRLAIEDRTPGFGGLSASFDSIVREWLPSAARGALPPFQGRARATPAEEKFLTQLVHELSRAGFITPVGMGGGPDSSNVTESGRSFALALDPPLPPLDSVVDDPELQAALEGVWRSGHAGDAAVRSVSYLEESIRDRASLTRSHYGQGLITEAFGANDSQLKWNLAAYEDPTGIVRSRVAFLKGVLGAAIRGHETAHSLPTMSTQRAVQIVGAVGIGLAWIAEAEPRLRVDDGANQSGGLDDA